MLENEEDDEIEEKIVNFAEVEKKANVKQEIITEEKEKLLQKQLKTPGCIILLPVTLYVPH